MKKLILSIALLAGMTFVACSDNDNEVAKPNYTGCQTCEILAANEIDREDYEVCVDADGVAYVADANTGVPAEKYFTLFCDNTYGGDTTVPGEGDGDGTPPAETNCVTCATFIQDGTTAPESKVCKDANGKAVVDGTTSTIDYDLYIEALSLQTKCQ
jgi:hypothetical protein